MAEAMVSRPLLEASVPNPGKEESRSRLNAAVRKVALAIAVCTGMSLCTIGISIIHASGDGHVLEMAASHTNDTDGLGPVPVHGPERVARLVVDPQAMYDNYGIVNMPIAYLNCKGFMNFGIQLVLFLGSAIWNGMDAIRSKVEANVRFNKVSIAFQVLGQCGVLFGMKTVVMATKPWQGTDALLLCCLLISQHASTVTAMVGLANNSLILMVLKPDKSISHNEQRWAAMLVASGMITSIPVWVCMVVACPYSLISLCSGMFFMAVAMSSDPKFRTDLKQTLFGLMTSSVFALVCLHLVWLIMAYEEEHMWLMLGAFVLEFLLPLFASLTFVATNMPGESIGTMYIAFIVSMSVSYVITTCVPAAVLFYTSDTGYTGAAPAAFWGKKIAVYGQDTFVTPGEHALHLWWSQMIGFLS